MPAVRQDLPGSADDVAGQVEVALDTKRTPKTTNAFVALSRWKYYDGTKLFRTEKDTGIIQGGSPHTQSNTDPGPGFPIPDEGGKFTSADYGPGTLAMARTAEAEQRERPVLPALGHRGAATWGTRRRSARRPAPTSCSARSPRASTC